MLNGTGEGYHYSYGEHNAATYIDVDKVKALKANWKYYLEEAEQEPDVQVQLAEILKEYAAMTPERIKCIEIILPSLIQRTGIIKKCAFAV